MDREPARLTFRRSREAFGAPFGMLIPGHRIGPYEIVSKLRSGGMATLYLARRAGAAGFARLVAIKIIHPHLLEDPTFVKMFVDEAVLAARVSDPNVVHVEELGESRDGYYLAMEYVSGVSLSEFLRGLAADTRRLSNEMALSVAMRIASGLQAVHEAAAEDGTPLGIVHRDVSPQNVMLSFRGHVKLIDFGIAKALGRADHTSTGSLRGKLGYMAPEQALGREIDARTDLYSLGVVLWEMLTMHRLFGDSVETVLLDRIRAPRVVPPSAYVPDLPKAIDDVVMKLLATDPAERPASAAEAKALIAKALPAAREIDAPHLASLIAAVLPERIEAERTRLPSSTSGPLEGVTDPEVDVISAEEILRTLTHAAVESALGEGDEGAQDLAVTSTRPPPAAEPERGPAEAIADASAVHAQSPGTQPQANVAETRARRPLLWVALLLVGVAAMLGMVLGIGALLLAPRIGSSPSGTAASGTRQAASASPHASEDTVPGPIPAAAPVSARPEVGVPGELEAQPPTDDRAAAASPSAAATTPPSAEAPLEGAPTAPARTEPRRRHGHRPSAPFVAEPNW